VVFDWLGSDRLRYRVRVIGPQGVMWEQGDLEGRSLPYPASAPALTPGATYVWELETKEHGRQIARFEVATAADVAAVREALAVLTPETARDHPPATLALMRAGALFEERFYGDAWRELTRGLATAPDEPALHLLLGYVYDRIGLRDLAGRSFGDAAAVAGP
jgi:Flp pilus assembly protein TadD